MLDPDELDIFESDFTLTLDSPLLATATVGLMAVVAATFVRFVRLVTR